MIGRTFGERHGSRSYAVAHTRVLGTDGGFSKNHHVLPFFSRHRSYHFFRKRLRTMMAAAFSTSKIAIKTMMAAAANGLKSFFDCVT